MTGVARDLNGVRESHARFLASIATLTDAGARAASLLPGWSVGHVLTHVARNGDSVTRRLEAAVRGELVDQYAGGREGRAAAIEAGAGRSAADLRADVTSACAALERLAMSVDAEVWELPVRDGFGNLGPTSVMLFMRWREVEVHHVDLGLGYEPSQWPPEIAERWLPDLLPALPKRGDPTALLAWLLRRGPVPEIGPWA